MTIHGKAMKYYSHSDQSLGERGPFRPHGIDTPPLSCCVTGRIESCDAAAKVFQLLYDVQPLRRGTSSRSRHSSDFRVVSRLRAHEPVLQNPLNYRLMVVSKGVSIV
jgi:hypothetical protein